MRCQLYFVPILERNKVGIALLHEVECFSYNLSYTAGPMVPSLWSGILELKSDQPIFVSLAMPVQRKQIHIQMDI